MYLHTVAYKDGYLICAAGLTRRPIPARLREHTPKFLSGDYTIMDAAALQDGRREEIWHGWGWSPEKRVDFRKRKDTILDAASKQLAAYRVFVADVDPRPRILERLEGAIWNLLYALPKPFCDIPDRGVMIAQRKESEDPILVRNRCAELLHGLPAELEI